MRFNFISGLPRSGSTLLSALLRQNPKFHAAMTSPLCSLTSTVLNRMSGETQFSMFFDDNRRSRIFRDLFHSYYHSEYGEEVFFDTSRLWTGRIDFLASLFPASRIICCVRDIGWIIDSTEKILRKNPTHVSRLFNYTPGQSVYARAEIMMNSEKGFIGHPWSCLREAWFGGQASRLLIVDYKRLASNPEGVMRNLYQHLDEPIYRHDFENVVYGEPDYDAALGMPGMHTISGRVEYKEREKCIPPDLFARYGEMSFWNRPALLREQISFL